MNIKPIYFKCFQPNAWEGYRQERLILKDIWGYYVSFQTMDQEIDLVEYNEGVS